MNAASDDTATEMPQPFQFSLGRLLIAIVLFALSAWLVRVARESPDNSAAATAAFPLVLGSAVGSLLGRVGVGAISIVVVYGVLGWLMVQLEDDPLINGRRRSVFERRRFSLVAAHDDRAATSQAAPNKPVPTELRTAISHSAPSVNTTIEPPKKEVAGDVSGVSRLNPDS